jgi:nucleoside-diphosphate-sugar epimerase
MNSRILVTGGSGFTGSHLCARLIREGYQVRTIARKPEAAARLAHTGVEIVRGDIQDFDTTLKATSNVEKVYHIAAIYRQEGVPRRMFWDINVTGTENLLRASLANGVARFIHCSTVGVHGGIRQPPANEDTPYRPGDHYQESKTEGEKIAIRFMREKQIAVTVFRPTPIYGPGDLRFLKLFKAIYHRRFWMIGSGNVFYHLAYIDDLIDGILLCGNKDVAIGRIYIIGGSQYLTLNALVTLIAESLAVRPPERSIPIWPLYALAYACEQICRPFRINPPLYRRRVDFFKKNRAFDISKAQKELGFAPKTDLKTGVRLTAEWYQKEGLL